MKSSPGSDSCEKTKLGVCLCGKHKPGSNRSTFSNNHKRRKANDKRKVIIRIRISPSLIVTFAVNSLNEIIKGSQTQNARGQSIWDS